MLDRIRPLLAAHYFAFALLCFGMSYLLLPTSKSVNNVFYALVALPGAVVIARRWRALPWRDLGFLLFLAWLVYGTFSGVLWGDGVKVARHALYVFLFYGVVLVAVNPSCWREAWLPRAAFWFAMSCVLFWSVYLWLSGSYPFGERLALPARVSNPIYAAIFLVSLWALAAGEWFAGKRYAEMLLATILVLFTVIISLQSRTGLVGFAAVIALLLIRARPLPELGVLTAVVTLLLAYVGLTGGMEEIRSWSFIARGDAYRWELWTKILHEAWDCGVMTGCGYGHNPVAELEYSPGVPIAHAHNIFIAQILFGGIIGLSLMLAMFGCSLLRGWRHARPWAVFLFSALIMLNFDGSSLIDNPDELWPLVHWPLAVLLVLNAQFATHSRHQPPLGAPAT